MAHFAQLNQNNVVTRVIVIHNNELVVSKQVTENEDGTVSVSVIESEDKGVEFCKSLYGVDTKWIQTSYNGNFRGKYAAIGNVYDAVTNVFVDLLEGVQSTEPVIEIAQAPVNLTSSAVPALTSEQISGL